MGRKANIISTLKRMGYLVEQDGPVTGVGLLVGGKLMFTGVTDDDIYTKDFVIEDLIVKPLNDLIVNHFKEVSE